MQFNGVENRTIEENANEFVSILNYEMMIPKLSSTSDRSGLEKVIAFPQDISLSLSFFIVERRLFAQMLETDQSEKYKIRA